MNTASSLPSYEFNKEASIATSRSPSWGAILAGAVAGLAAHFLLLMLGTALGLGAAEPATDDNPLATFGTGSAVVWSISALISLYIAGWVAGRCAARVHSVSGSMHGFLVWCVATITMLLLVTLGAGAVVGGATKILGQGLSALGKPIAGATDMAKDAVQQNGSAISSFIDEATQSDTLKNAPHGAIAARREIGEAVRRLFRENGNLRDPEARNAVITALTQSGMSQEEANGMVDRWASSMERLRADLDQAKAAAAAKAREAAEAASKALSRAALWSFIGFVIGALAASLGGRSGQWWEYRHTELIADPTLDPSHRTARGYTHSPGHA